VSGSRSDFSQDLVIALIRFVRYETNLISSAIGKFHDIEPAVTLVENGNTRAQRLLHRIRDRRCHRIVELCAHELHTGIILLGSSTLAEKIDFPDHDEIAERRSIRDRNHLTDVPRIAAISISMSSIV
jgi:hypothetical protein